MDIKSIIRANKKRNLPKALVELNYFRNLPTYDQCINNAGLAIHQNGKKNTSITGVKVSIHFLLLGTIRLKMDIE